MNNLLDMKKAIITDNAGNTYIGAPISICYRDESSSGENEIDVEVDDKIICLKESEISEIKELED